MSGYSVSIEGLSKKYRIYSSNKARLAEMVFFGKKTFHREFWALKDVSFNIESGETFGIIGANGAGKSTLLKILAGITKQSSGTVNIIGKVAALLELGAGFHPDFTGRENLYMNGALLGFGKTELDSLYDEIVDFSELHEFMDMPVKTYSSGMYVRLAFSIATTVNPDVLIVDEALSVGDEYFQKKCIDRIKSFMDRGKTIILVSHDINKVKRVCKRALWLEKGNAMAVGDSDYVVAGYIDFLNEKQGNFKPGQGEGEAIIKPAMSAIKDIKIEKVQILDDAGNPKSSFRTGEPLTVKVSYNASKTLRKLTFGVAIYRNDNIFVTGSNTLIENIYREEEISGSGNYKLRYRKIPLLDGTYFVTVGIFDENTMYTYDYHDRLYQFTVDGDDTAEGMIMIPHDWELEKNGDKNSGSMQRKCNGS